ncbi:MAG: DUF1214 domain-containing protein [Thermoleophilia bacterium]|nr:DUF1214 domain-containing protein [Thermoleophilia bacterium]
MAATATTPVRWDTYVRAQSDTMFKSYADDGAFGKFFHIRKPTPIDQQKVIRMNRDTLYSMGVFDLTDPVTITKPDTGDRYQSMMVVSQDEYIPMVVYKPGDYTLTQDEVGTRYVVVVLRTLVDATKPEDITAVNAIQDKITTQQASAGTFEIPNWDQRELKKLTDAINVLADTMTDTSKCFGTEEEVEPIEHLLGAAFGWGGLPAKDATYDTVTPEHNDGTTPQVLTVKDVPVDGFWSVSLYNKDGYYEKNPSGVYVINDRNATKGSDGSVTIHFGGDPSQPNHLYITDGWNYTVRLYRPRKEILNGSWAFPAAKVVS